MSLLEKKLIGGFGFGNVAFVRRRAQPKVSTCGARPTADVATVMGDNMKTYFTTGLLASVVLASTLGSAGCCCQRKGIVLRGDWSLELNRVPHMRSNGPTYSGDACTTSCEEYSCTSCDDGSCIGCRSGGRAGGMHGADCYESVPGGAGGSRGHDAGSQMPAPPQPTPAAQSRFHPVPTRPVFEPQQSVANVPYDAPVSAGNGASSRRAADDRRPTTRPAEQTGSPRSNRVAVRSSEPPMPQREFEPALFEAGDEVGEALQATNDEAVAAADESAEEPTAMHATSSSPAPDVAWRVKARRS